MKAALPLFMLFLATSLVFPAQVDYKSPLASLETIFNSTGFPSISSLQSLFGMGNSTGVKQAVDVLAKAKDNPTAIAGITGAIGNGNLTGVASAAGIGLPAIPIITIPLSQLRMLAIIAVVLFYVFAAGKIADFLQSTGRKITKREALFAPFAFMFVSIICVAIYFLSGVYRPPQDTLITNIVYLVLVPAGIMLGVGSAVLYGFFRDRLNFLQSLDLSIHIVLSPIFDGIKGYWTALGAAVILGLISTVVFYSTGGRLALATFDFLLLSSIVSLYYLYRMLTTPGNENKAGSAVTILCLLAPSILQRYLKDAVCSLLVRLPFDLFRTCPLDTIGSDVTLMVSIGATMLLLIPVVPILYAFTVNLLRAYTLAALLLMPEPKPDGKGWWGFGKKKEPLDAKTGRGESAVSSSETYGTGSQFASEKGETSYLGKESADLAGKGKESPESKLSEDERESEEIAKKYRGSRPTLDYPEAPKPEQPKAELKPEPPKDEPQEAEPKAEPKKPKKKGKKKK